MAIQHIPSQKERFIVTIHFTQYKNFYKDEDFTSKINQDIINLINQTNSKYEVDCGDWGEGLPILKVIFNKQKDAEDFENYMNNNYAK